LKYGFYFYSIGKNPEYLFPRHHSNRTDSPTCKIESTRPNASSPHLPFSAHAFISHSACAAPTRRINRKNSATPCTCRTFISAFQEELSPGPRTAKPKKAMFSGFIQPSVNQFVTK
jgi:hypothetical protein